MLAVQDAKIESLNKKLKKSHTTLNKANMRLLREQRQAANSRDEGNGANLVKVAKAQAKAQAAFTKAVERGVDAVSTGSGRVMLVLPGKFNPNNPS